MNLFAPSRYDERITALAIGVQPYEATTGNRLGAPLRVALESVPRPLATSRRWRPGETLDDVLPVLPRHRSGRYGLRYDEVSALDVTIRVLPGGRGDRRIVPRRVRAVIAPLDPAPPPPADRITAVALFPGAAGPVAARGTVIRGTVVAADQPMAPRRWARIVARDAAGAVVAWAHGDDRGEFVMVIGNQPGSVVVPTDPLELDLQVAAVTPQPAVPVDDPSLAALDPSYDLPADVLPLGVDPLIDTVANGRRFHPDQTQFPPVAVSVPLGRHTTLQLAV